MLLTLVIVLAFVSAGLIAALIFARGVIKDLQQQLDDLPKPPTVLTERMVVDNALANSAREEEHNQLQRIVIDGVRVEPAIALDTRDKRGLDQLELHDERGNKVSLAKAARNARKLPKSGL